MLIADINIEFAVEFALVLILAFFGSLSKDYMRVLKDPSNKISIATILLSTIISSLIAFAASPSIQAQFGVRALMLASYILGLVGFDLLERASTINGLVKLWKLISDLVNFFNKRK